MSALKNNLKVNAECSHKIYRLATILLWTPKQGRTWFLFWDCGGWILRFALLPLQNIINVVIDNTSRVSILQQQLPQFSSNKSVTERRWRTDAETTKRESSESCFVYRPRIRCFFVFFFSVNRCHGESMTVTFIENVQERDRTPRGRGGTPRKIGYWQCGPLPKTLILFMSKICDFPYPIYDRPDQNFDNVFMTLVHSCLKHKFVKGFSCWLYLACVVGVKRGRGRKSTDGRRRAWWRSSF